MRTVRECLGHPRHAGALAGACRVGEAARDRLLVRVGLWLGPGGRVERARYQATTCPALVAYADVGCEMLESGVPPEAIDAPRLRSALAGVHPIQRDRARLVVSAIRAAASRREGLSP